VTSRTCSGFAFIVRLLRSKVIRSTGKRSRCPSWPALTTFC